MEAQHLDRVKFLVRQDAWAAWTQVNPPETEGGVPGETLLNLALAEYRDLRVVAAYVLDTVCADARRKAVQAAVEQGGQTKSYEVVGEWKEEFFASGESVIGTDADLWCARAQELRSQAAGDKQGIRSSRTVAIGIETRF